MATLTIRPGPTVEDGFIRSISATYSTARNTFTGTSIFVSGVTLNAGQRKNGSNFELDQAYLLMPLTDPALVGATITAIDLETTSVGVMTGQTVRAYAYDNGGTISGADWRTPTDLASMTQVASVSFPTSAQTFTWTSDAAFVTAAQAAIGGNLGVVILSDNLLTGTPPTGEERSQFRSSDHSTAGERPAFIITYTPASADVEIDVPLATLTLSSQTPSVLLDKAIGVPAAALSLTGYAPSVAVDRLISVPAASLTLTGHVPSLLIDAAVSVPLASLTLTALAPSVAIDKLVSVPVSNLTLTAYAPSLPVDLNVNVPAASLTLTGYAPAVLVDAAVNVPLATLGLMAYAPDLLIDRFLSIPVAGLTLTAHIPTRVGPVWKAQGGATTDWAPTTPETTTWTATDPQGGSWAPVGPETTTWTPETPESGAWTEIPPEN